MPRPVPCRAAGVNWPGRFEGASRHDRVAPRDVRRRQTTTSGKLVADDDHLRHFDPEWVGYMLTNNVPNHAVPDFQQYPLGVVVFRLWLTRSSIFTGQHLFVRIQARDGASLRGRCVRGEAPSH